MTTEQLNTARAELWRQAGNPLLTADEATAWLRETGLCLFLPRGKQLATAAPSFVEAVHGAADATPSPETIEQATTLLRRMLSTGDAVALNLLGAPGEQPDLLATSETLPFLFALVGDKEWKRGPRGKSSPLVIEVWKLLEREGPLSAIEVKEKLGRQLTEAAALRALAELWSHLRIEPVFPSDAAAGWQLLERAHAKQMQAGSTMSQATALSALVSLYLQSAVAASGDEVELFLSPVASRSKVRDVVKGLTATRQLNTLNLGPVEMYHVEGSLPEFAEAGGADGVVVEAAEGSSEGEIGEGRRRFVAKRLVADAGAPASEASAGERATRAPRPARHLDTRPGAPGKPKRDGASEGPAGKTKRDKAEGGAPASDRRPFSPRKPAAGGNERKPYGTRNAGGSSFNPREPWKEDRKTEGGDGESRPAAGSSSDRRPSGERKPFTPREGSERKPYTPREGSGERKPFAQRSGDRPFKPRSDAKPSSDRKSFGDRKPYAPREGGNGERKSFAPRTGDRPFKPRADGKPFGDRKRFTPREGGERKPYTPREGGGDRKSVAPRTGDRPFKPRSDGKPLSDRKPFTPREGSDRKPYTPRENGAERKSVAPRTGDRPFKPRFDGKPLSDRKPFTPREGSDRKPYTPRENGAERKSFAPRTGDRPFKPRSEGKPFGDREPFAPREGGDRKPYTPRENGAERKSFAPRTGDRPVKPRSDTKPFSDRTPFSPRGGERPPRTGSGPTGDRSSSERRPATPGARKPTGTSGKPTGRARTSPVTSSGKPRTGVRPPTGRPGPRATRGGAAKSGRPGLKRKGPRK